jgi:GNAT superfamily N-acetyltransferase
VNYQTRLAIVGLVGEPGEERIIAIGRYELDEATRMAELAFVVHEEYRHMGLASHLLQFLKQIALDKKFAGVTAQVLSENKPMLDVFNQVLGPADSAKQGMGETTLCYRFLGQKAVEPGTQNKDSKE